MNGDLISLDDDVRRPVSAAGSDPPAFDPFSTAPTSHTTTLSSIHHQPAAASCSTHLQALASLHYSHQPQQQQRGGPHGPSLPPRGSYSPSYTPRLLSPSPSATAPLQPAPGAATSRLAPTFAASASLRPASLDPLDAIVRQLPVDPLESYLHVTSPTSAPRPSNGPAFFQPAAANAAHSAGVGGTSGASLTQAPSWGSTNEWDNLVAARTAASSVAWPPSSMTAHPAPQPQAGPSGGALGGPSVSGAGGWQWQSGPGRPGSLLDELLEGLGWPAAPAAGGARGAGAGTADGLSGSQRGKLAGAPAGGDAGGGSWLLGDPFGLDEGPIGPRSSASCSSLSAMAPPGGATLTSERASFSNLAALATGDGSRAEPSTFTDRGSASSRRSRNSAPGDAAPGRDRPSGGSTAGDVATGPGPAQDGSEDHTQGKATACRELLIYAIPLIKDRLVFLPVTAWQAETVDSESAGVSSMVKTGLNSIATRFTQMWNSMKESDPNTLQHKIHTAGQKIIENMTAEERLMRNIPAQASKLVVYHPTKIDPSEVQEQLSNMTASYCIKSVGKAAVAGLVLPVAVGLEMIAVPGSGWYALYMLYKNSVSAAGGQRLKAYLNRGADVRVNFAAEPKLDEYMERLEISPDGVLTSEDIDDLCHDLKEDSLMHPLTELRSRYIRKHVPHNQDYAMLPVNGADGDADDASVKARDSNGRQ